MTCPHPQATALTGELGSLIRFRCLDCGFEWTCSDDMRHGCPPYGRDVSALRMSDPWLAKTVKELRT